MSASGRDWFKTYTGIPKTDAFRRPAAQSSVNRYVSRTKSKFPLIPLGWGDDGEVVISQEDRANHMHILGATQEGKSKFIELLIRDDIKNGYGACLIDPTRGGATAYKVLKYCQSIGHKKVCLIDPSDMVTTGKIPVIQPLRDGVPEAVITGNMMDVTRILWDASEFAKNPRITRYLPAVLQTLVVNKLTLAEVRVFLTNVDYHQEREALLAHPDIDSLNRSHIKGAFKTIYTFEQFQSTVNRLNPFNDPVLRLMLGSRKTWGGKDGETYWGVPWAKLITEGWVILVNADPTEVWGHDNPVPQRLMGTLIIGELLHTIGRLVKRGWHGSYYLYVDEAGYYATRKVANILDYHAKTGLRLVVAHQRFDQIEDDAVLSAIRSNAKNKVLFFTSNTVDREVMMRDMGYGGELPDRQVSYVLGQLQKGQAAISIGKKNPRITKIRRIDDVKVDSKALTSFKDEIYSHEWYYSKKEIEDELNARFTRREVYRAPRTTKTQPAPKPKAEPTEDTYGARPVAPAGGRDERLEDSGSPEVHGVPHDSTGGPPLLRHKKRR